MSASSGPAEADIRKTDRDHLREEMALKKGDGGQMQSGRLTKSIIDAACISLNIASTVTLVFLNKWYVLNAPSSDSIYLMSRLPGLGIRKLHGSSPWL